jgi:hypothetical protein
MQQPHFHSIEAGEVYQRADDPQSLPDRCTDVSCCPICCRGPYPRLIPLLDEVLDVRSSVVMARSWLLGWEASREVGSSVW